MEIIYLLTYTPFNCESHHETNKIKFGGKEKSREIIRKALNLTIIYLHIL